MTVADRVLDAGLNALLNESDRVFLCATDPTTYASANSTHLGQKNGVRGSMFTAPSPITGGRQASIIGFTDGSITSDGVANYVVVADSVGQNLLVSVPMTNSQNVILGGKFAVNSLNARLWNGSNVVMVGALSLVILPPAFIFPALAIRPISLSTSFVVSSPSIGSPIISINSAGQFTNAEVNALATITPTPTTPWLQAADTMVSSLKTAGVWQTLDLFYCPAAPSSNATTYNWVDMTIGRLTANGTLNYTTNTCVSSNGTTGYFSSTFNVNSGKAVNGNAEFGFFTLSECTTDAVSPFQTAGGKHFMTLQASSTGAAIANMAVRLNTSTSASFSSLWGSTAGHWAIQQNTLTQLEAFIDGKSIGTSAAQTNSLDTGAIQLLRSVAGAYTTRQISFAHYGSKLTAAQHLALSKALYKFLTTMDVRPKSGIPGSTAGPTNIAPYKHIAVGNGNNLTVPVVTSGPNFNGGVQCDAAAYPYNLIRVNDPNYLNLFRLEVHSGDPAPFDGSPSSIDRAQFVLAPANIAWQTTCDISFSFWVESGSVYGNSFLDLIDFHDQTGGVNCGPTHAFTTAGKYYVWGYISGTYYEYAQQVCPQGQWHTVRTTFRPDLSPNGFIQSWLDGVQIVNDNNRQWATAAGAPFWWNIALYRGGSTVGPTAVWIANLEIDASGTQPFASRITTPLPAPPLT